MVRGERFAFLDVVRGIAVLWMIQVHVTNVLLAPSLRTTWFFDVLNVSNGYVAPTFIFCAGAGLWIALQRRGHKYLRLGADLFQYLRRLAYILFWGYALHTPYFSLAAMATATHAEWMSWLQVDVLPTIVYSSIAALALFLVVRNLRVATWAFGVVAAVVMCSTWYVWQIPPSAVLPEWLAIMVSPAPASPFPIIPWSAYLFAGAFVTGMFIESNNKDTIAKWMFGVGLIAPFLIFVSKNAPWEMPWDNMWWKTSPGLHVFRICATLLLLGALYPLEHKLRTSKTGIWLQKIGNESLFIYVGHLLLVYGPMAYILQAAFGTHEFGYLAVAIVWIVVTALFIVLMNVWHWIKRDHPIWAKRAIVIQLCWMILSFIFWPA